MGVAREFPSPAAGLLTAGCFQERKSQFSLRIWTLMVDELCSSGWLGAEIKPDGSLRKKRKKDLKLGGVGSGMSGE